MATTLKDCEADGIIAYVPPPSERAAGRARAGSAMKTFRYDAEADVYRCPAEALLRPTSGRKTNTGGRSIFVM